MNLIYIYFLMSCVQWIFKWIFSEDINKPFSLYDLLLIPIKPMTPYWYIYTLIILYLIFYFLEKAYINDKVKLFAVVIISFTGSCIVFDIIFPIKSIMIYTVFFYVGIMLSKHNFNADIVKSQKVFFIKLNNLDVYGYLLHLLTELPKLGECPTDHQLDSLMPWAELP